MVAKGDQNTFVSREMRSVNNANDSISGRNRKNSLKNFSSSCFFYSNLCIKGDVKLICDRMDARPASPVANRLLLGS